MTEIKLFNKYSFEGIEVQDPGLINYISLSPIIVPKTGARYAGNRFHKSGVNIVERLINKLMVVGHKGKKHFITSGHHTGKSQNALLIAEEAFEIIEGRTKKNPVEVLVRAIENAAPREEIIAIEHAGARYPRAVEVAPQRRIDLTLKLMTQGAFHKSFQKKKNAATSLAEEIINAYNLSNQSSAISKKQELERQADASR